MISQEHSLTHRHAILCALDSSYVRVLGLTIRNQSKNTSEVVEKASASGIKVRFEKPRGQAPDLEARISWDLFRDWKQYRSGHMHAEKELVVFLDRIQDPQNAGNIIRTARFFGASAVVIPKARSVKIGETIIRASTGAALSIPIVHAPNLVRAIESFQEEGAYVWGLAADAKSVLDQEQIVNGKLGLVIGSEGEGMANLTVKTCDQMLKLSKDGHHESLNAASAAAIAIYECEKKVRAFGSY